MKSDSDDELFGQMVSPTPSPLFPSMLSSLTESEQANCQIASSQVDFELGDNENYGKQQSSQRQLKVGSRNLMSFKLNSKSVAFTGISNRSSEVQKYENEDRKSNTVNSKQIQQNQSFQCYKCMREIFPSKCDMCKGKQKLTGDTNLVKFLQYVLEFKLGNKEQYSNRRVSQKQKPNKFCGQFFSNPPTITRNSLPMSLQNSLNLQELRQKCTIKSAIHHGFACDNCDADPIRGVRYHCNDQQCDNDYDLCEDCEKRVNHRHDLVRIEQNGLQKQAECITKFLTQPSKVQRSSLRGKDCWGMVSKRVQEKKKVYFSSIH